MNKLSFIQTATANSMTWLLSEEEPEFAKVVEYAELAWQRLCEAGHGAETNQPRALKDDWYKKLQGEAKQQFDALYKAFNWKKGRNGAAQVWFQMGDVPQDLAKQIIEAAKDAAKYRDPECAKWLQGWLNERRWEDYTPAKEKKETKAVESIQAQIKNLRILARHDTSGEIQQQIRELEENGDG